MMNVRYERALSLPVTMLQRLMYFPQSGCRMAVRLKRVPSRMATLMFRLDHQLDSPFGDVTVGVSTRAVWVNYATLLTSVKGQCGL
jgi:hypothetical protein